MANFNQPLSFMGTNKIKDKADREKAIAIKNGTADATSNDPENDNSHRRTRLTDQSNIRVAGGKAAGPKPIKANYDADDARIVDLKQQGYTDEYVARKLASEGRIRYVGRTVGSRWLRIRKALEAKEEEILEDEMSDWHDGEDERLEQAVKEIDAKIEKEIAKLREKKWQQVAAHVAELIQKKKYTPRLCRERFDGLMDGTALKPIELDSDQEGRRELRSTRVAMNKRLREEAAAAQEADEQRRAAANAAKKASREANVVVKITKAQQKKIDEDKISAMKKDALAQRKSQKATIAQWSAYIKIEARWTSRKQNAERKLCNKIQGLPLSYRPSRTKPVEGGEEAVVINADQVPDEGEAEAEDSSPETDAPIENETDAEVENNTIAEPTNKHHRSEGSVSDNPAPRKKSHNNNKTSPASPPSTAAAANTRRASKSTSPKHVTIGEAPVTDQTRASPRSVLTIEELNSALAVRDLPRAASVETQEQVVARLCMEDAMSSQQALRAACLFYDLSAGGTKAQMALRLAEYEASRSAAEEGRA